MRGELYVWGSKCVRVGGVEGVWKDCTKRIEMFRGGEKNGKTGRGEGWLLRK